MLFVPDVSSDTEPTVDAEAAAQAEAAAEAAAAEAAEATAEAAEAEPEIEPESTVEAPLNVNVYESSSGDKIIISGNVENYHIYDNFPAQVTIRFNNSQGNLVSVAQTELTDYGSFSHSIHADELSAGTYTIEVRWNKQLTEITFQSTITPAAAQLVNVSSNGELANDSSYSVSISANGQFVVFISKANNLVEDDQNSTHDVFVRDLLDEKTYLVSVSSDGTQGGYESSYPTISGDGRYVVFMTSSALDPDDTNSNQDVYMRDMDTGTTFWINSPQTAQAMPEVNHGSSSGKITSDGKYVIFRGSATHLGLERGSGFDSFFLYDVASHTVTRLGLEIDQSIIGTSGSIGDYVFSGNGNRLAFALPMDWNRDGSYPSLTLVYDIDSKELTYVLQPINEFPPRGGYPQSIDYDGNRIVFSSNSHNLVENDENGDESSLFLYDMITSKTKLISIDENGKQFDASRGSISDDGKFVIMQQQQANQILIYDVEEEKIHFVSHYSGNDRGISEDGNLILVEGYSNLLVVDVEAAKAAAEAAAAEAAAAEAAEAVLKAEYESAKAQAAAEAAAQAAAEQAAAEAAEAKLAADIAAEVASQTSNSGELVYVLVAAVAVGGGIGAIFIIKKGSKPSTTVQQESPSRRQTTVLFCSNCGNSLKPEAKFCGKCGNPHS